MRVSSSPFLKRAFVSPPFEDLLFVPAEACTRDAHKVLETYPEELAASLFIDILDIVDKYKQAFKTLEAKSACPRCGYPRIDEVD